MKKLLYISLLFVLFSCTKFGKNVRVKGRAVNPITGEGIEGIKIRLIGGNSGGWNGSAKILKTVTTDAEGNFDISKLTLNYTTIDADQGGNYYEIGWFVDGKQTSNLHPKIGKTMHVDYWAVPYGYLKLSVHNVNCTGGDKITLDMQPNYLDDYSAIQPLVKDGCYNNDFIESKVPSGNWNATWQVTKSGITTNHDTTFFIPGNGHCHLTINY